MSMPDRKDFQGLLADIPEEFEVDDTAAFSARGPTRNFSLRRIGFLFPPKATIVRTLMTGLHTVTNFGRSERAIHRRYHDRRNIWRIIYSFVVNCLAIFGLTKIITLGLRSFVAYHPDELDFVIDHWGDVGFSGEGLLHWPTDFTGGIEPIQCHSHNDYWRDVPLFEAIQFGCVSVEADIWLFEQELFVGHTSSSLTRNRTLKNMYIDPLLDIIERQNPVTEFSRDQQILNGVFDTVPSQTLVLLLDFKSSGPDLWPYVLEQLSPLRDRGFLTHWDGTEVQERPITIVGSGNAPFDLIVSNTTYRDVFFDAPLESFGHDQKAQGSSSSPFLPPYTSANSYYASTSYKSNIGHMWTSSHLSPNMLSSVRAQIHGAHAAGLKVRYWGIPSWPRGLRNHVWHILIREGVDILNTDDLKGATLRDWRRRKGWWF